MPLPGCKLLKISQGGVKVPTGGDAAASRLPPARERPVFGVSRFGENPKPTVTVRMEENGHSHAKILCAMHLPFVWPARNCSGGGLAAAAVLAQSVHALMHHLPAREAGNRRTECISPHYPFRHSAILKNVCALL